MKDLIKKVRNRLIDILVSQGCGRECLICGWTGYCFLPYGISIKRRFDAKCPSCGSLERHRLAYLIVNQVLQLNSPDTLHVAPERCIEPWLQSISKTYVSIDLGGSATKKMDLRKLEFGDDKFSLIWCSGVMEHIVEDNLAIKEMFRVCRPNRIALIIVPVWRQTTYENYEITSEEDRQEHFYQKDHVRLYGLDIVERFEKVGFSSRIVRAHDFGPESVTRHSLSFLSTNKIFIFTK